MSAGQSRFQTHLVPDLSHVTAKPHRPPGSPSVKINLRMRKTHHAGREGEKKNTEYQREEVGQKQLRHWTRYFPIAQREDYPGAYIHTIFHEGSHVRAGPGNPSG